MFGQDRRAELRETIKDATEAVSGLGVAIALVAVVALIVSAAALVIAVRTSHDNAA